MLTVERIVNRIAEGIPFVDRTTSVQNHNRRTKDPYLISAVSLDERQLVEALSAWWASTYPKELPRHRRSHLEYPYTSCARENCDLVIAADENEGRFDWAIEVKKVRLVGDNGKNNDYVIQKILSPWLKDRSLRHDAERLKAATFASRKAVVLVGFDFRIGALDAASVVSDQLCISQERVNHLRTTLRSVDRESFEYALDPAVDIADEALILSGAVKSRSYRRRFQGLDRHPCGTGGLVCGWEVSE